MTCRHVLGLLDAGPSPDYPSSHLEAAWAHAAGCPTCGPALVAARAVTARLHALAQPAAPVDLKTVVMARVAALPAEESAPDTRVAAVPAGGTSAWRDWSGWAPFVGVTIAVAAVILNDRPPTEMIRSWPGTGAVASGPPEPSIATLALMGALGIFVLGLLLPLRRRP